MCHRVALELAHEIAKAEGQAQSRRRAKANDDPRAYILELYEHCGEVVVEGRHAKVVVGGTTE